MNQYLVDKLKEGRLNKGLKQSDVTKLTGIKNTTLSNYENGNTEPDMDTFLNLCNLYELDYAEIIREAYGYRIPGIEISVTKSDLDYIKKYRSLDAPGREIVDFVLDREAARSQQIAELEKRPAAVVEFHPRSDTGARMVKYFRSVSAGGGVFILGNESASQICISDPDWDDRIDYVINVAGDSMKPDYCDGDKVKVSQRVEMFHGDVGIFVINGSAYIKEYGENELISRNPEYPNISIAEYDNIVCMGKVLGKLEHGYEIFSD